VLPVSARIDDFRVSLLAITATGVERRLVELLSPEGAFAFGGLFIGSYDLEVAYIPSGEVPVRLNDIEIGPARGDIQLDQIDLAAHAQDIRIRVAGADGSPVSTGTVVLLGDDGQARRRDYPLSHGSALLTMFGQPLDIAVLVGGYQLVTLREVSTNQNVALASKASSVVFTFAEDIPMPQFDDRVQLELTLQGGDIDHPRHWWQPHLVHG